MTGLIVTKASKNMAKTEGLQSLEELKAENAANETKTKTTPQVDEVEEEIEVVEVELDTPPEDAESNEEGDKEAEIEDWMTPDGHTTGAEKKFTDGDIGKAKAPLKAKLKARNEEVETLRAEIEQLKDAKPQSTGTLTKPRRDDFLDQDDPDEAYLEALTDHKLEISNASRDAERTSAELQRTNNEAKRVIDARVDQHYEDAEKLIETSGISAEVYHAADLKVRQMIDSVFPKSGDVIMDAFISKLGKGSEKTFFSVGIKPEKLAQFEKALREDSSGMSAAMFLGQVNESIKAPSKRKTKTPAPLDNVQGDAKKGLSASAYKSKYDTAHKRGNPSEAYNVLRAAKKSGVDTSGWNS